MERTLSLDALAARHDWQPQARPADMDAARQSDERVTARTLLERCRKAADAAVPTRAEHEREDLAADLAEWVAGRHGWTPRRSEVRHGWLVLKARRKAAAWTGWKDQLGRPGHAASDAPASGSVLAQAAGLPGGVIDMDAARLAAEHGMGADETAAVIQAMDGRGAALHLAAALGISEQAARKRLERGRAALARRWATPDLAAAALADLAAREDAADLAAQPVPVDGRHPDGPTRAARVLAWIDAAPQRGRTIEADPNRTLAALMYVDAGSPAAALEGEPRTGPQADTWRRQVVPGYPTRALGVLAWIRAVETGAVTGQVQTGERPHGEPPRRPVRDRKHPGTALPQGRTGYGWKAAPDLPARKRTAPDPKAEAALQAASLERIEAAALEAAARKAAPPTAREYGSLERPRQSAGRYMGRNVLAYISALEAVTL